MHFYAAQSWLLTREQFRLGRRTLQKRRCAARARTRRTRKNAANPKIPHISSELKPLLAGCCAIVALAPFGLPEASVPLVGPVAVPFASRLPWLFVLSFGRLLLRSPDDSNEPSPRPSSAPPNMPPHGPACAGAGGIGRTGAGRARSGCERNGGAAGGKGAFGRAGSGCEPVVL